MKLSTEWLCRSLDTNLSEARGNSHSQFVFAKLNRTGNMVMGDDSFLNSPRSRFRAAMVLAVVADAVQIVGFPLFVEGALSPLDDILDVVVAVALFRLLGWHWEFLPSLIAELMPGVDLVPFWTLAVANVYRKWKQVEVAGDQNQIHGNSFPLDRLEVVRQVRNF